MPCAVGDTRIPFPEFVRKCKDCSLYMSACSFIQQTVVSSSRCYVDFLFTDHIVEFICIHTSCIHHIFCLENALIRMDFPDIFRLFQFFTSVSNLNSTPFSQAFSAIAIFNRMDIQFRLSAHRVPAYTLSAMFGLHLKYSFSIKNLKSRYTICHTSVI